MKTRFALLAIAFAILIPSAAALAQADTAGQMRRITNSYQEKLAAYREKTRSLPPDEQAKLSQAEYPDASGAIASITELIKENPTSDASLDGIVWILRSADLDKEIYTILEEHHLDNEKLVSVTSCLARRPTPEARAFLKLASEKSWLKDVRGAASYYYAVSIEGDPSKTDEYSALVEKLFKDYSDVDFSGQKLVKSAEGKVSLRGRRVVIPGMKFRIGKQASEIIGQDVDGKQMKLSDYRGKVVVIDFWGDW